MNSPVICFGQQPCGFFPKRFLVAKIQTARRLQSEIGGEIVFFFHDSDHDPRETKTALRHRKTNEPAHLNFAFANKTQRKFSPLHLKQIPPDWQKKTALQLPNYVEKPLIEMFESVSASNIADFCLEMYRRMGLLDGIRVVRSSDPELRRAACDIPDFFADVSHAGEIVRARFCGDCLKLHEGGNEFIVLPLQTFAKEQISPVRDTRLRWMQSILHCTHYIAGAGEQAYLRHEDAPEINFVVRDTIDRPEEAYVELS
ncbi:MAG TPA: hypothetical protein VH413_19020 [Verrucomicrobiae bacterium]|jgi:hypothetical protein|nr:hypothetical protein [Verrucomicrobiae bacterium]